MQRTGIERWRARGLGAGVRVFRGSGRALAGDEFFGSGIDGETWWASWIEPGLPWRAVRLFECNPEPSRVLRRWGR